MNKQFTIIFAILLFFSTATAQLVSYEKIDSLTLPQLTTLVNNLGYGAFITPEYAVDIYRVMYDTEYKGGTTEISGIIAVPKNTVCKVPLVSYQHGTVADKLGVPSYNGGEKNIVIFFASLGNLVCASDYIGLGASTETLHPYMHAFSQAHSSINLLRSAREMDSQLDFNIGNQLFLFGYSQGGFASAAIVKYIETEYSDEFKVTASAPMSGPYNMAGAQYDMVNSGLPYSSPGYLPYVILSYQLMYENLYTVPSDFFKSPYDSLMPYHFFGHNSGFGNINSIATPIPTDMIKDSVITSIRNNPNHPFRLDLLDNDFINWTPKSPMKMIYCEGDDQVSYLNAVVADSAWNYQGAPSVESENWGNFDHSDCFQFALIDGKNYLESFYNNGVEILVSYDENNNSYTVELLDDDINDYNILWNNSTTDATLSSIDPNTVYSVTVTHKTKSCSNSRSFKLSNITAIDEIEANVYFNISPNPATNFFKVNYPGKNQELYIVNVLGEVVLQQNISNQKMIDVSSLITGLYFVGINGVKSKSKLIIK